MVLSEYKETRQSFGMITKNGLSQRYNIFIFEPSDQAKTTPCKEKQIMSREIIAQELAKIDAPLFDLSKYSDLMFVGGLLPQSTPFFEVVNIYNSIDKNAINEIKARMEAIEPHVSQIRNAIKVLVEPILNRATHEWNTRQA